MAGAEDAVDALLRAEKHRKLLKRRRRAEAEDANDVVGEDDELDMSTKRIDDGQREEQDEEDAGGTVREELVGFAAARRATARRGWRDDGDDVEAAGTMKGKEPIQTQQAHAGDDDIRITPFNLDEEKREGSFDEAGHFVSKRKAAARRRETGAAEEEEDDDEDGEGDEADRWLEGVGVADLAKIRQRRLKEMEARRESAQNATVSDLDEKGRAELKGKMMALMMRGETVGAAIRRLGKAKKGTATKSTTEPPEASAGDGLALKELIAMANALMDDGDLDTYSLSREDLEKGARMFASATASAAGKGASARGFGEDNGGNDDDDDDMFADEEPGARDQVTGGPERGGGDAPAKSADPKDKVTIRADDELSPYQSWPVAELRRFLRERPHPRGFPRSINDKDELVRAVAAAAEMERRTNLVSLAGFSIQTESSQATLDDKEGNTCTVYVCERLGLYYYPEDDVFCRCATAGSGNEWLRPTSAATFADGTTYCGDAGTYFHIPSGRMFNGDTQQWM